LERPGGVDVGIAAIEPSMDPMTLALNAMKSGESSKDPPVGAALRIGDKIVGTARNRIVSARSFLAHAENSLLIRHGPALFQAFGRKPRLEVTIYTTLEPCLLCTAAAAHSRVKRIVYACRDPMAGCCNHQPPDGWYRTHWPILEHDPRHEAEVAEIVFNAMEGRGPLADAMRGFIKSA
jgi:tRNA(Arg) A34 adenosine deaminase TadA